MDGRDAMALSGSASYYMQRGFSGSGSGGAQSTGFHIPPGYRPVSNPSVPVHSNVRGSSAGSTFPVEHSQPNFSHGVNMGMLQPSEPAKKKRGRPRKYGPDGAVSLGLSPMSARTPPGSITPGPKRGRGRPPGSGRKQQLAALGQWMNDSAGLAFAPHIITISMGEDIAAKILSFSQQRPRALCILSGNGTVSSVTLRQPTSSGGNVTYEGRFEILCLSGSYLLSESGGPRSRVGGINVSLSSPDGHVIGGAVGMLIAAGPVQVVACSFVYGGSKSKNKAVAGPKGSENLGHQPGESSAPPSLPSTQNLSPTSAMAIWSGSRPVNLRNPHTDIDLTQG
ncbi:AT-hook motif nuclear-localized protein 5 [Malania oleifera]|uniref:AT-hook motif nuclear-localized protein 5 n=1 Tax=Malania oleifera TaxID=397392 RepID=UPI0025AE2030|nr:AT-hook motif nuclear-localized protein 5 [Malania oleifera]